MKRNIKMKRYQGAWYLQRFSSWLFVGLTLEESFTYLREVYNV
jgi:hypothetical protein